MAEGDTIEINVYVEWHSESILPHDFSVVVWSTAEPVTLTLADNHSSQSFPNYTMASDVTLNGLFGDEDGIADTDLTPVVDTCDNIFSEPFKYTAATSLNHHFCIDGRHQHNEVQVVGGERTLIQETRLTLNNDKWYDF